MGVAMDVSDGLGQDAARLAAASGVGIEIDADSVPLSEAARADTPQGRLSARAKVIETLGDEALPTLLPLFAPVMAPTIMELSKLRDLAAKTGLPHADALALAVMRGLPGNVTTQMELELADVAAVLKTDANAWGWVAETPAEGYAGCCELLAAMDITDDLPHISAPTLVIAGADDAPSPTQDVDGLVCWLSDRALRPGSKVLLKHTTRTVQGIVKEIKGRLDLDTLTPVEAEALTLNDIGRVSIRLAAPIVAEPYTASRRTGAFLLIDPQMGSTLAAGMVRTTLGGDEFEAETLDWSI